MNAAELFTGCGGLALGLERAGFRHSFFAESDESCREILRRRFPGVPIVEDVRDVGAEIPAALAIGDRRGRHVSQAAPQSGEVRDESCRAAFPGDSSLDLLAGGFPCQPFSAAGKRKGEQDDRYLWPEFARAIRVLQPRAVLLENVPGILSMALDSGEPVFGRVMADLAEAGYDAEWFCLRASDVGAPHRRERVFVVAHAGSERLDGRRGADEGSAAGRGDGRAGVAGHSPSSADSPSNPRRIGDGDGGVAADADADAWRLESSAEQDERENEPGLAAPLRNDTDGRVLWGIYEPAIRRWESVHGPAPRPTDDRGRLDPRFPEWMLGFPEGWVEGVSRTAQLRMLGNAVQVQVAELVGAHVYSLLEKRQAA